MEAALLSMYTEGRRKASRSLRHTVRRRQGEESADEMPSTCDGVCREENYWKDGLCDFECNNYACGFDGGDCTGGFL